MSIVHGPTIINNTYCALNILGFGQYH